MFKAMILLKRNANLDYAEFQKHWLENHAALVLVKDTDRAADNAEDQHQERVGQHVRYLRQGIADETHGSCGLDDV